MQSDLTVALTFESFWQLLADFKATEEELVKAHHQIHILEVKQRGLVAALSPVGMSMKLDMDFVTVGSEGSTQRQAFEKLLKQDIVNATGITPSSININSLSAGSVNVDAELMSSTPGPDPYSAAMDMKRQARDPQSKLRSGGLTGTIVSITVRDIKTLQETVTGLQKQLMLKQNSLDLAQKKNGELAEKLKEEHENVLKSSSQLTVASEQIESDHLALAKNRNTLMELQETLAAAGIEIAKLKVEREAQLGENATLKHNILQQQDQIAADQRNLTGKSARIDELENAVAQMQTTIKNFMAQSQAERDAVRHLEERLRQAQEYTAVLTRQLQEERTAAESLRIQYADLQSSKERDLNAAAFALKKEREEKYNTEKEVKQLQVWNCMART